MTKIDASTLIIDQSVVDCLDTVGKNRDTAASAQLFFSLKKGRLYAELNTNVILRWIYQFFGGFVYDSAKINARISQAKADSISIVSHHKKTPVNQLINKLDDILYNLNLFDINDRDVHHKRNRIIGLLFQKAKETRTLLVEGKYKVGPAKPSTTPVPRPVAAPRAVVRASTRNIMKELNDAGFKFSNKNKAKDEMLATAFQSVAEARCFLIQQKFYTASDIETVIGESWPALLDLAVLDLVTRNPSPAALGKICTDPLYKNSPDDVKMEQFTALQQEYTAFVTPTASRGQSAIDNDLSLLRKALARPQKKEDAVDLSAHPQIQSLFNHIGQFRNRSADHRGRSHDGFEAVISNLTITAGRKKFSLREDLIEENKPL